MPASENQSVNVVGSPDFFFLISVTGDYASESQSVKVFGFPVVFFILNV